MLVLTRRVNEGIAIGDGVVLKVIQIRGKTVRLGIEAPREISVRRIELEGGEEENRK